MKMILLFYCLFLHFSTVFSSELDIDAFVAFVKGPTNFDTFCTENGIKNVQTKKALTQFYGLRLGILYRLKRDWNCENANEKAATWFNKDRCEHFGKCLLVLYEYFANVHAGHKSTRPIFESQSSEIPFADLLDRLAWICNNFLNNSKLISEENTQIMTYKFVSFNLQNELNYERNAESTKEEKNFDEKLAIMYEKAEEWVKLEKGLKTGKSAANFYDIILDTPTFYINDAVNDGHFIDFIKDEKNLNNSDVMMNIDLNVCLGLLYLMKSNWNCANAKATKNANECGKLRHYLDILYDYLLRERFGLPAMKPMFQFVLDIRIFRNFKIILNLQDIIDQFDRLSVSYFGTGNDDKSSLNNLELTNEKELNYKTDISKMTFEENVVQIAKESADSVANEKQQKNGAKLLGLLRYKFDNELEEIQKRMVKKALEEKSKLEALKAKDQRQLTDMEKRDLFLLKNAEQLNTGFFKLLRSNFCQLLIS